MQFLHDEADVMDVAVKAHRDTRTVKRHARAAERMRGVASLEDRRLEREVRRQ